MERKSKPDLTALLTALSLTSVATAAPALAEDTKTETSKTTKVSEKVTKSSKVHAKDRSCSACYPCGCHYGGKSKRGRALEDEKNAAKGAEKSEKSDKPAK